MLSNPKICQISETEFPDLYFVYNHPRPYFVAVDTNGEDTVYKVSIEALITLRDALNTAIKEVKS